MKLYKYMSMEVFEAFVNAESLRLTKSYSLNDPFEFSPSSHDLEFHFNSAKSKNNFYEFINMAGCISMSTEKDSISMWSHYADSHRGVVIEFDFDDKSPKSLFFGSANVYEGSPTDNPTGFRHSHVKYTNSRENGRLGTNYDEALNSAWFTKSNDWDREKEYRFILPYTEAGEILIKSEETIKKIANTINVKEFNQRFIVGNVSNRSFPYKIDRMGVQYLLANNIDILYKLWQCEDYDCIFTVKVDIRKISGIYFGINGNSNKIKELATHDFFTYNFLSFIENSLYDVYKASADSNLFKIKFIPLNLND